MNEYQYCTVINKIKPFFEKIQDIGKPEKVSQKWLASIGFKSTNDRKIVSVLKSIGFIDGSGNPTDRWKRYKNKSKSKKVMAEGLNDGYSELFKMYPDAGNRSREELYNFFSEKMGAGKQVVDKTVSTFLELCTLADLNSFGNKIEQEETIDEPGDKVIKKRAIKVSNSPYTININIQLTVPETTDGKVYEKFFEAMKKHLFS